MSTLRNPEYVYSLEEAVYFLIIGKQSLENLIFNSKKLDCFTRVFLKLTGIYFSRDCEYPSIMPSVFIDYCLPYSYSSFAKGLIKEEDVHDIVNPWFILGGTYKSHYRNFLFRVDIDNQIEHLNEVIKIPCSETEFLQLLKIGAFPLYIALEGKNRILLFQKFGQEVPARVIISEYPPSEKLELVKTFPWGIYILYCYDEKFLNKERNWEVLPFQEMIIPLLHAYGVKIKKKPEIKKGVLFEWRKIRREITMNTMIS